MFFSASQMNMVVRFWIQTFTTDLKEAAKKKLSEEHYLVSYKLRDLMDIPTFFGTQNGIQTTKTFYLIVSDTQIIFCTIEENIKALWSCNILLLYSIDFQSFSFNFVE
jgi:hypothetical protein